MLFSLEKNDELQWCWINYRRPYHTSSHTFFVQIDFHPRYLIVIFTFSATEFKDNLSLVIALAFIHIRILMFKNILKPSSLNINGTQTNTHYVLSIVMDDNVFWMAYFFQYHSRIKKQIHQNRSDKREQQWNRPFFQRLQTFFPLFHDTEISGRRTKDTGPTNAIIFSVQLIELAFQILHFRIRMPKLRCQIEMNENWSGIKIWENKSKFKLNV